MMTPGFKKTQEGIELTTRTVIAVLTLVGVLSAVAWRAVTASQKLEDAVGRQEFRDTTEAIRDDMEADRAELRKNSRATLGIQCWQANYPASFCDSVPRVQQAGKPR